MVIDFRYAEIVNVKLGNGQTRKGQVLEIAGRKAVVQVSLDRYPLFASCLQSLVERIIIIEGVLNARVLFSIHENLISLLH